MITPKATGISPLTNAQYLLSKKYEEVNYMLKKCSSIINVIVFLTFVLTAAFTFQQPVKAFTTESYTWKNVNIGAGGGFVPGIIFNTKEKDLIYARTDIGGAYRWNPANNTWIPLTDWVGYDDWNKNGVDALATDPVDPNRVYMAVGTYTNSWDTNGAILRSSDKGNTWQSTPLPFKVGGNMPGRSMGERLMIDPNKNSIIYFGARSGNGLWRSIDYGVTWSKVNSFTAVGTYIQNPGAEYGSDPIGIAWITFDPRTGTPGNATQTIYVGVADKANSVYRSTDGGATWQAVPGQPTGYLPHHGVLSSTGMLYISYSDGCGPYDGAKGDVWKFNTATGAWTNISPVPSSSTDNYYGYGGLAVDAQRPNTIMVATLNSWWPDAIIFRSTDGGSTWTRIWDWGAYPERTLRYTHDISAAPWLTFGATSNPPDVAPKLGWMIGDLEIDPFNSDRMMYGTGATIYGTNNLTAWDSGSKINLKVMAQGIEETAVLALISPPTGANLYSGLGDICGFRHDDVTKVPPMMMTSPIFVSTTSMDYAELNPSIMVRVGNVDKTYHPDINSSGFSYNSGSSWFQGNSDPSGITGGGMVAMSADGSSVVWSPNGTTAVYYSKNNGSSWTPCSGLPAKSSVASDRVNPNKFYGFYAGKFYISTDGGASFTQTAATGLPNSASILHTSPEQSACQFKAVPGLEGHIWFVGGSNEEGKYGMWRSTDSGATFTKLSNVQEANVIGFGKAAPGQNYMALYTSAKIDNVRGIFRSTDIGATWVRINDDQHQYARTNMCITGDPRIYGRVYLGTNGRGIVYGDSVASPVNNSSINPTTASFDKKTSNQADIVVTMTLNGNTLTGIKNGAASLVSGTDYTVSGSTVTIRKSYLASRPVGTTSLTFDFSAGIDPVLAVNIVDTTTSTNSTITPTTASFDKNTANQADVAVTMALNGNTLSGIKNGTASLVSGTDYTVSGSIVTIIKSYLAAQPVGTTSLTFDFSAGTDPVLAVTISDTTPQSGSLKIQAFNGTTSASSGTINPKFKLVNTGTTAISLSNVKIRYYYTIDAEKPQSFTCDWSHAGPSNVTGTFVKMPTAKTGADYYVEIGFNSTAGTLAAGQSTEIHIRVNRTDWSNYTQTGDYSFNSSATSYVDWSKATAYLSGTLQWGTEP